MFWACDEGQAALFRQLRTLNQVRLPGVSGPDPVLFRHWDPRVLADVVPALDGAQSARVLGPAQDVLFDDAPGFGGAGLRRLTRVPDLPAPARGVLALTTAQVAAVDASVQTRSLRKVAHFLRDAAPGETGGMPSKALHRQVSQSVVDGRSLGLRGERALGQWSYLTLVSHGAVRNDLSIRAWLSRPGTGADQALDRVFARMIAVAQPDAHPGGLG